MVFMKELAMNRWFLWKNWQWTAGPGYFKNLKGLMVFMKEMAMNWWFLWKNWQWTDGFYERIGNELLVLVISKTLKDWWFLWKKWQWTDGFYERIGNELMDLWLVGSSLWLKKYPCFLYTKVQESNTKIWWRFCTKVEGHLKENKTEGNTTSKNWA